MLPDCPRAPGGSTACVTTVTQRPRARSLAHRDDDGVAPEAEHQPRPLRLQVHDHACLVLQPEIAATRGANRKAIAGLTIGAGELPEIVEVVHLARRLDGGEANAPNADATHLEVILRAAKEQDAGAPAAAADVGRLHLVHLDATVRDLALDRVRTEGDVPRAPGNPQEAHACENESRPGGL